MVPKGKERKVFKDEAGCQKNTPVRPKNGGPSSKKVKNWGEKKTKRKEPSLNLFGKGEWKKPCEKV